MFRRVIKPILFLPLALSIKHINVLSSETKNYIDNVLEEKANITFVDYQEIEKIVLNNQELKSLEKLVTSASFNLSSQISQKYPSLDFQAIGLPKYVAGRNYNSNSDTLKTSQFTANPSLNIRWDLIDPLRESEIKIAKENYKISKNNYEIKKKDLIHGLKNKDLGEAVYIPSIMLKLNTDLFLDDKNIKEVENQLNTKIHVLDDSNDIINTLIG